MKCFTKILLVFFVFAGIGLSGCGDEDDGIKLNGTTWWTSISASTRYVLTFSNSSYVVMNTSNTVVENGLYTVDGRILTITADRVGGTYTGIITSDNTLQLPTTTLTGTSIGGIYIKDR